MKECKGCLNLNSIGRCGSRLDRIPESNQCPCLNCVVKMVCRKECKEFRDFLDEHNPNLNYQKN